MSDMNSGFKHTFSFKPAGDLDDATMVSKKTISAWKPAEEPEIESVKFTASKCKVDMSLMSAADEAISVLQNASMPSFSKEIKSIISQADRQKFTVAVVGEFSRGKSTFINNLLGKNILPVANMPTTAMLTRIRYSHATEDITIIDASNKTKKKLPLSVESWEDYIAADDGNDPNGVAFVNVQSPLLKQGIEIIDTPGAGDLETKRAALIGDALKDSDAAIITISAQSVLSLSEKLFIEQRLISNKTPFLMLIITKLDQIEISQRSGIVKFVKDKLALWNMNNIDVYIPYNIQMTTNEYDAIIGMDKVVRQLNSWVTDDDRQKLTNTWTAAKLKTQLQSAINFLNEKKKISSADAAEKQQLIERKAQMLTRAERTWEEIKLKMLQKSDECYKQFKDKAVEQNSIITEKLEYELMHTGDLRRWWNEDFPYRLKVEMTNLSVAMEALVSRNLNRDLAWLNASLEKNFKTNIVYTPEEVAEKSIYTAFQLDDATKVSDMTNTRKIARLGVTATGLGVGLLVCPMIGIPSLVGTMGIGTGGPMITEAIFKKKTDSQRETIKNELKMRVPKIITKATSYSMGRIKNIYNEIIADAAKQQAAWLEQQQSIVSNDVGSNDMSVNDVERVIVSIKGICAKIDAVK